MKFAKKRKELLLKLNKELAVHLESTLKSISGVTYVSDEISHAKDFLNLWKFTFYVIFNEVGIHVEFDNAAGTVLKIWVFVERLGTSIEKRKIKSDEDLLKCMKEIHLEVSNPLLHKLENELTSATKNAQIF